jgi:murein DD-endopeptidase MepM/ murein hydrolase activator NlpD
MPTPTLLIPTLAATFTEAASATPPCTPRSDWQPYTVQRGDTLTRISQIAGVSVADLLRGNCLTDTRLIAGQVIRVPRLAVTATPLPDIGGGILPGINAVQCDNSAVRITSPTPGSTVSGNVTIFGSALIPDFSVFYLNVRAEGSGNWVTVVTSVIPVESGVLGSFDSRAFGSGVHWVQVLAVDSTSSYPILPCSIRLNFAN